MREECQEPQIYLLEHVPATIARAKTLNGHVLARALTLRHLTYEQFTNHINAVELPEANQALIKSRNLSTFGGGWGAPFGQKKVCRALKGAERNSKFPLQHAQAGFRGGPMTRLRAAGRLGRDPVAPPP